MLHTARRSFRALTSLAGILVLALLAMAPRAARADDVIAPQAPATCLDLAHSCVTVPVTIQRTDATGARAYSVTFSLSAELTLCAVGSPIASGGYLANPSFQVIDNGGGSYTVDETTLGSPCGATGNGTLFTIQVQSASTSATGTVMVNSVLLRDCDDNDLAVSAGPAANVTIQQQAPAALALSAAQRKTGNSASPAGTTDVLVSWTGQTGGSTVAVYRKGFGGYPRYDDAGGVAPVAPANAAAAVSAGWTLTSVANSGDADRVANRDVWYYVAFTTDACGNVSGVSNLTSGTHNYELGDVSDNTNDCTGDDQVGPADVSLLGMHYGATLDSTSNFLCLDVGPTSDHHITGRPLTDHQVQFEDLVVFAIDYGLVSSPSRPLPAPAASDAITLGPLPARTIGATIEVPLVFSGTGLVKAVSAELAWNHAALEFAGVTAGDLLGLQAAPGLALSSHPGNVDVALLGEGSTIAGNGTLALARFRVTSAADPQLTIASLAARDADGQTVAIAGGQPPAPTAPGTTGITRVYPNPVRDAMSVQWSLARAGRVTLAVYDLAGRRVRTLLDAAAEPGIRVASWDGRAEDGRSVANGFYVVRLLGAGVSQSHTIRVVR